MPIDQQPTRSHDITTAIIYGALGAGLIYFARRSKPGLLTTVATTAGYSLLTKAVSNSVLSNFLPNRA